MLLRLSDLLLEFFFFNIQAYSSLLHYKETEMCLKLIGPFAELLHNLKVYENPILNHCKPNLTQHKPL